jgi:hypothetical protein
MTVERALDPASLKVCVVNHLRAEHASLADLFESEQAQMIHNVGHASFDQAPGRLDKAPRLIKAELPSMQQPLVHGRLI